MIASIFTVILVQPIFNILVFIYGVLPGHNFGLAIILFTVLIRVLLWPLVKKQLHQTIKMRALQPELKLIKKKAKNRQQESLLMMELYKERGINPFSSIGVMLIQLPVLITLYVCLQRIIKDPNQIVDFAYSGFQNLPSIKDLAANISLFDNTLFGIVDLSRAAFSSAGTYWPALIIVLGSAVAQYFQSKQLMPVDKDARKLRAIMKESASTGKQADQAEVSAAVSRTMIKVLPIFIFLIGLSFPSALGLYWLVASLVAWAQQSIILKRDSEELMAQVMQKPEKKSSVKIKKNGKIVSKEVADIPEAEVIEGAVASNKTIKAASNKNSGATKKTITTKNKSGKKGNSKKRKR